MEKYIKSDLLANTEQLIDSGESALIHQASALSIETERGARARERDKRDVHSPMGDQEYGDHYGMLGDEEC